MRFDPRAFGMTVRGARGADGLRSFSRRIGMSASTLLRVEKGKRCQVETFLLLCEQLELNPASYGGRNDPMWQKADGLGMIRQGLSIIEAGKRIGRWK